MFNAFSLLGLGGSISEHVPLWVCKSNDEVHILDTPPSLVGHALDRCQDGKVGSVELGGPGPLRKHMVYEYGRLNMPPIHNSLSC